MSISLWLNALSRPRRKSAPATKQRERNMRKLDIGVAMRAAKYGSSEVGLVAKVKSASVVTGHGGSVQPKNTKGTLKRPLKIQAKCKAAEPLASMRPDNREHRLLTLKELAKA